jgi:CspA family cold shock protein
MSRQTRAAIFESAGATTLGRERIDRFPGQSYKQWYLVFGLPCLAPGFGPLSSHLPKLGTPASGGTPDRSREQQRKETTMATGTVKWFNPTKGYGFIQPQGGGKDVFVHISAVERAGLSTLNEGQIVQYEVVSNRGKESADSLKVG